MGIPKSQGRYIYLVRDPTDVAVSYYHFHCSHLGYRGNLERFLGEFVTGKVLMGSWFQHVSQWRARAGAVNVLLLRYEELQQDLEGCVRRIAAFCNFRVPDTEWPRVLERCSFKFMKEHEAKFDHLTETLFERGQKMHAFLRRGGCGEGAERITAEQIAAFKLQAQRWGVSEYVA